MTDTRKHFKGQLEGEIVICTFRKHWVSVLPVIISVPGLFIVLFLFFVNISVLVQQGQWLGFLMVFALAALHSLIHRQFLTLFHYYLNTVILTDRRIVLIDKSVFFKDSKNSIDLAMVQDIQKNQVGFFQNMLNFGSLTFMLSASGSPAVIDLVPRPEYQYKKIHEVKAVATRAPEGLAQAVTSTASAVHAEMAG